MVVPLLGRNAGPAPSPPAVSVLPDGVDWALPIVLDVAALEDEAAVAVPAVAEAVVPSAVLPP
jgi:hypothetical protein